MKLRDVMRGMGNIFDLRLPEREDAAALTVPTYSDEEALKKDWEIVGKDLLHAAWKQSKNEHAK